MAKIIVNPVYSGVSQEVYHLPGDRRDKLLQYLGNLDMGNPNLLIINAEEELVLIPMRNVLSIIVQDNEEA